MAAETAEADDPSVSVLELLVSALATSTIRCPQCLKPMTIVRTGDQTWVLVCDPCHVTQPAPYTPEEE